MTEIELLLDLAKQNAAHIVTLNDDYTDLSINVAKIAAELGIMMKFFWLVMGAVIANLIASFWALYRSHKS